MVLREPRFWQIREYRIAAYAVCASFVVGLAIMGTALALRAPQSTPLSEKVELPVAPQLELAAATPNTVWSGRNDLALATATPPSAMSAAKQATLPRQIVPQRPRAVLRGNPDSFREIFGTASAEIGNAKILQRWNKVLVEAADRSLIEHCNAGPHICEQPMLVRLRGELARLRKMEKAEMVAAVNTLVNRSFRYAPDSAIYGVPDHWATLEEMLRNGAGDCEDFAIAKMWILAAAGVPRANMRLVVLRDIIGRVDHAVLVVSFGEQNYVLDNRQAVLRADSEMKHYRPFYSLSADGKAWVHALPPATQQAAVQPAERD